MEILTRELGIAKSKQVRNKKLEGRYQQLWLRGFTKGEILDKLEKEFYLSRPRIYGILKVREIQKRDSKPGKKSWLRKIFLIVRGSWIIHLNSL